MALLAGGMCGVRNDSCFRKHKYARTSHGMASESLSRGVDLFFAQEFCFIKQEHGPPRGSKQAKTDVLLTTVAGPLRCSQGCAPTEAADRVVGHSVDHAVKMS